MLHTLNLPTIRGWQTTRAALDWSTQWTFVLQDTFTALFAVSGAGRPWKIHPMERHGLTSRIIKRLKSDLPPMFIDTSIEGNLCHLLHCIYDTSCTETCWFQQCHHGQDILSCPQGYSSKSIIIQMISTILACFCHQRRKMTKWVWLPIIFHQGVWRWWGCCT